ncbi:MAG: hypothetical protein M0R06_10370 [Sphaerochaeta sp.]|jgi:hypothetical protein|nr:hypothetical protein [Sphaerochaeta sp.]
MAELLQGVKCIRCGAETKGGFTLGAVSFRTDSGTHNVPMGRPEGPFCNTCTQARAWELVAEEEKILKQLSLGKTIDLIVQTEE